MTWDRLMASAPINRAAAVVAGKSGGWTPAVALQDWYPDMPDLRPAEYYTDQARNPEFTDFRGREFGRLRVIGVMLKEGEGKASWVCRCICGAFCTRKARSLREAARGGNSFVAMCGRCDYQRKLATGWAPGKAVQP